MIATLLLLLVILSGIKHHMGPSLLIVLGGNKNMTYVPVGLKIVKKYHKSGKRGS